MQTNKAPSVEDKVLEELPQDPPTEILQIIEENQETVETEKTVILNEHQVCNKSVTTYYLIFVLHYCGFVAHFSMLSSVPRLEKDK